MKPTLSLVSFALLSGYCARGAFAQPPPATIYPRRVVPVLPAVMGVVRDAGWWRLNGSLLTREAAINSGPGLPGNGAVFVAGLKRTPHARTLGHSIIATEQPMSWCTCSLPPLREIAANGYDFAALQARLTSWLATAGPGRSDLLGFSLPVGGEPDAPPLPVTVEATVTQLKTVLAAVAPQAALILDADATRSPGLAARDIDAVGASCDAVEVRLDARTASMWPVKVARKVAEEQPLYDLPIFVRWSGQGAVGEDAMLADCIMSGATGLILSPDLPAPAWLPWVEGNLPLFVGSVTLEDIGLTPASESSPEADALTVAIYEKLRAARRVPLLGRLVKGRSKLAEPVMAVVGDTVSSTTVADLRATATLGAPIYIEGNPKESAPGTPGTPASDFSRLVGATAMPLPPQPSTLSLDDPWTFGTSHGALLQVQQRATLTLTPPLDAHHAKPEKGRDVLIGPIVVSSLGDGSPGIVVNPVGKGEVMWLPHALLPDPPVAPAGMVSEPQVAPVAVAPSTTAQIVSSPVVAPTPTSSRAASYFLPAPAAPEAPLSPNGLRVDINRSSPTQRYYQAIAGHLQPALVQVRGTDPALAGAEAIRVALRRSARGSILLWLSNTSSRPAAIAANIFGVFNSALDLGSEVELPVRVRGDLTEINLTVPAGGYRLIALAVTHKLLDDERNGAPH